MTLPDPPVNVRLVMTDGSVKPVDTVYNGIVKGQHNWVVVNPPPANLVRGVQIDSLPAQTSVTLATTSA